MNSGVHFPFSQDLPDVALEAIEVLGELSGGIRLIPRVASGQRTEISSQSVSPPTASTAASGASAWMDETVQISRVAK